MISSNSKIKWISIILIDQCIVLLSFFISFEIRNYLMALGVTYIGNEMHWADAYPLLMVVLITWWVGLSIQNAYRTQSLFSLKGELKNIFRVFFMASVILAVLCFYSRYYFSLFLIILFYGLSFLLLSAEKMIIYLLIRQHRATNKINVLVVGAGEKARDFLREVEKYSIVPYKFIGFLDETKENIGKTFFGHKIIGTMDEIKTILERYFIEMVFFILPQEFLGNLDMMLKACVDVGVEVKVFPNFFNFMSAKARVEHVYSYSVISFTTISQNEFQILLKRLLDIAVSALLLVFLSPGFLILAIIIKLTTPGTIFYPWRVVGKNNRDFVGYKFRTMVDNADKVKEDLLKYNEMQGPVFKIKNDPRITPFGKFLRKYSLDEIPQLYSVFKGDMSLVGPRPPSREESDRFEFWQRRKISIKPGMTCLWQVNGRNAIRDFNEWIKLDLEYIDNWSLWLDIKILYKTFWVVLRGTGV